MKIIKFALFERKDLEIIKTIDELYDKLLYSITNSKFTDIFIVGGELYLLVPEFIMPLLLCISDNAKNYSFGRVAIGENKIEVSCLWIPKSGYLENKLASKITLKDVTDTFKSNKSSIKHELTHIYDYASVGRYILNPGSKSPEDYDEKKFKEYFNIDLERNAYFIQSAIKISDELKMGNFEILNNFKTFMNNMRSGVGELFFDHLEEKNKKKYISRCYLLYKDMRKKYLNND